MSLETQRQIRENVDEAQDYLRDLHRWESAMKDRSTPISPSCPSPPRTTSMEPSLDEDTSAKQAEEFRRQGNAFFRKGDYENAITLYTQSLDVCRTCLGFGNRAMAYLKLDENEKAEADCTAALECDVTYLKAYQRRSLARQRQGNLQGALVDAETALRLEPTSDVIRSTFNEQLKHIMAAEHLELPKASKHLLVEMDPPLQTIDVPVCLNGFSFDGIARVRSSGSTRTASVKRQATETVEKEAGGKLAKEERTLDGVSLMSKEATHVDITSRESEEMVSVKGVSVDGQTVFMKETRSETMEVEADEKLDGMPTTVEGTCTNQTNSHPSHIQTTEIQTNEACENQSAKNESQTPPTTEEAVTKLPSNAETKNQSPFDKDTSLKLLANEDPKEELPIHAKPSPFPSPCPSHASGGALNDASVSIPAIPKTWASFESGYKSLKHHPEAFGQYLFHIEASTLPVLFKSALTAPILAAILEAVLQNLNERTAASWKTFLDALKSVPRYDMLRMCFTSKMKMALKQQWLISAERLPSDMRIQLAAFFN